MNERLAGGLIGLLVGDALGVPYEFHHPDDLPTAQEIEYDPPPGFPRAHHGVLPGTWSDDGAQALCLLASLLKCGSLNPEDFGRRLVLWVDKGYQAVDGLVFDVGNTTSRAIEELRRGTPAVQAGPSDEYDNGNGALMRVLPLALWHTGCDAGLVCDAHTQSQVTHGHMISQVCCAIYCLWARATLESDVNPWESALRRLRDVYFDWSFMEAVELLDTRIMPELAQAPNGSGYVVDCLRSARWACQATPYEEAVRRAISLCRDTDTTACVAGGIAGIRFGLSTIPQRWVDGLRGKELYQPLLNQLLERITA